MREQPALDVEYIPTDTLVPYARNAKAHSDRQVEQIANSIREFGFCDPIGVWTNGKGEPEIIEGHGRVLAAKRLGMDKVPVVYLNHLSDAARRAYTHIHNQLTLVSDLDMDIIEEEIAELPEFDWEGLGFDDLAEEEQIHAADIEEDEVPEQAPARAKCGQVWRLGEHRLMCGDSSNMDDIMVLVAGGGLPMMVFTDPPYGVAIGDKNKMLQSVQKAGRIVENIVGDTLSTGELYDLLIKCFSNLREVCDESCSYYVSSPQGGEISLMMMMMRDAGLPVRHNLIWKKNSATFSMGRLDYDYKHEPIFYTWTKRHSFYSEGETTILEYDKPRRNNLHPTMKPVALVAHLMENSSKPGDTVMDIFGGSGTTLIAAEQLGRRCLMMEIDPHYCDVIIKRWENLTGLEAVLA